MSRPPSAAPVVYLIDASSYVYRAFFALPALTSPAGLPTNAAYGFTTMLLKLLRETTPAYVGAVFDAPGPTFRDELFEPYKANRPAMPDDLAAQLPLVHELVEALGIRSLVVPGVEADDVIGTAVESLGRTGARAVIVSGDKDLLQLVSDRATLWDTMRDRRYDVAAVRKRFGVGPEQIVDIIALMGDPIDNIPGVKGIGEKTATLLVQRFGGVAQVLAHLADLEAASDVRGAKRLAATLRAGAEIARLSRELAVIRRDVAVDCALDTFRFAPPAAETLRPLFTRLGFQSLLASLARSLPATTVPVRRTDHDDEWQTVAAAARAAGRVALAADEHGVVVAAPAQPLVYVSRVSPALHALCADNAVEKVAHDLKRDLRCVGVRSIAPAFDVMVASHLLELSASHRLEDLATEVLGRNLPKFRDGPVALAAGASLLSALCDHMAPLLRERSLDGLFRDVEMPLVPVLAAMEQRGVCVDAGTLRAVGDEIEGRLAALMEEIHALAGGAFNISSPPQLREVLFDRLGLPRKGVRRGKTGLSTDVDVLTRLAADHPLPAKILDYRALSKLKSTYVDALLAAVDPGTGRLHTTFNQTVTVTGRLSSSEPNLQNIPIRTSDGRRIRGAFVAAPGCLLVAADYSQIELRLLAHLSEDAVLLDAFHSGADVHARTAAEVFGVLPGTVTPEMRRAAKVINFGILYGMGPQRLARDLAIPVREAERYIATYFARYAGVRAYLDATIARARTCGYVTTLLGRRRALPDLASPDRAVAQAAERTAANTPIQGSAADVIKVAMVALDRRLAREGVRGGMILQVHDELVVEVAEADVGRTPAIVREEMEHVMPLRVPLVVGLGMGRDWATAHP
jgi:DNA polymerase-1